MAGSGTQTGPGDRAFPQTSWTIIFDAKDRESPTVRKSIEKLARLYWRPIYTYFRRKWSRSNEEAKDLTQDFFLRLTSKGVPEKLSPEQGRFRSYVMAALDNFVRQDHRRSQSKKRGGGAIHFAIRGDDESLPSSTASPEKEFLREWAGCVMLDSLHELEARMKKEEKEKSFEIFMARDIHPPPEGRPSYDDLAKKFGVTVPMVTNFLFEARKKLRELVLSRVRDTVTTESEAEHEIRELFGEFNP